MNRKLALPALLAAAVAAGVVGTVTLGGARAAPASAPPPAFSTARVRLTDLATTALTAGTLGYAPGQPVVNLLTGTYTWFPAPGQIIVAGQALYRVDDQPVILMTGSIPAWRAFMPGMASGRDIKELQANLIALGDASGLLTAPDGVYGAGTQVAVERWQHACGLPETGQVALGQVVFLPGAVRVGAPEESMGDVASPGSAPYQVTTATRTVLVPYSSNLPPASVGERLSIVLPSNADTLGVITAIGPPPAATGGSSGSGGSGDSTASSGSGGSGGSGDSGSSGVTAQLTVTPLHPGQTGTSDNVPVQVALTVQSVQHVLAVPVTALLALSGGGYGVQLVLPSGAHRLVGVSTGLFAGGLVQVSGPGIVAGARVVTAQ